MKEIVVKCYPSGRAKVRTTDVHVENENLATQIKIDFTETSYENYHKGVDIKTKQNLLRYFLGKDPVVIKELKYENTVWGEMVITPFVFSQETEEKVRFLTDYSVTIQRRESITGGSHGGGDAVVEIMNIFQSHIEDYNNPHQLTAEHINLENVKNYGVATQEEMEADDDKAETLTNEKYVTPQRTRSTFISFGDLDNENSRIRNRFYTKDEINQKVGDVDFSDFAKSVNNKLPDGNGNISITIADLDGVPKTRKIAGVELSSDISQTNLTNALRVATDSLSGIMSAADHAKLTSLYAIFDNDSENYVDTLREILEIFENYPESTNLITLIGTKADKTTTVNGKALSGNITLNLDDVADGSVRKLGDKVDKNALITAATKTKITYDSKGLVTAGADLVATDIPNLPASKITQTASARFVTDAEKSTWNGKQNALGFTPENITNKVTTITASSTNTQYPSAKAVYDAINNAIIAGINGGY